MARVLVIEDEPSISRLLRILLENGGHEVFGAHDGSRGVATATRRSPDAILLDVMMPFMDGFAVLETLREDDRTVSIPVMMLSAIQRESVEALLPARGPSVRRKPFDPDMLLGSLQDLLAAPRPLPTERVARGPRDMPLPVILAWREGA